MNKIKKLTLLPWVDDLQGSPPDFESPLTIYAGMVFLPRN